MIAEILNLFYDVVETLFTILAMLALLAFGTLTIASLFWLAAHCLPV